MGEREAEIDCSMAVRQLWDYLDEELTDDRMAAVRAHLAICVHCLSHAEFGERFLAAVQHTRDLQLCPAEVRARVMASLRAEGFLSS
jgi:anti-sigma factor (TIGR02949 family)